MAVNRKLVKCGGCGKERLVSTYQVRLPTHTGMCKSCSARSRGRENNPNWQGGRFKNSWGYIDVRLYPEDPYYSMATTAHHKLCVADFPNHIFDIGNGEVLCHNCHKELNFYYRAEA